MQKLLCVISIASIFMSCKSQFPIAYNHDAKNPDYKAYIKPKNGDTLVGNSIEKKNEKKIFKATLYSIKGKDFKAKEIDSYQDQSGLYQNLGGGALVRALTGPNIYVFRTSSSYTTYNAPSGGSAYGSSSQHTSISYYIKKAGQPDVKEVGLKSTKKLAEWVEDNSDAYEAAQTTLKFTKSIKINRLASWAAIIGGIALIAAEPSTKNNGPQNVTVLGYGGLTLLGAGIVDLNINLFHRRGKAGRAYAEAINIYNESPRKRKK